MVHSIPFFCFIFSSVTATAISFSVSPHSSVLSTATLLHLTKIFRLFKKDPFMVHLFESESKQNLQHCMLILSIYKSSLLPSQPPPLCPAISFVEINDYLSYRIFQILDFPSPGDLPDPGIKPGSLALQADSLPSEPPGKPIVSF